MSKVRRTASAASRATKEVAAKAKVAVPKVANIRVTKRDGRSALRVAAARSAARTSRIATASGQKATSPTRVQKAARQVERPKPMNGELRPSDADVLRIASAVAKQRKDLMDRLAR